MCLQVHLKSVIFISILILSYLHLFYFFFDDFSIVFWNFSDAVVESCDINEILLKVVFITRLTRRVPLVEQELLTLPEHLSSPPVFSGVRVTRSLVFYVCFVDRCLPFCTFSFRHCVVCSSSIYGFWLPFGIFKLFLPTTINLQNQRAVVIVIVW